MTLDGKIASRSGASRWISGAAARRYVHRLRALAEVVVIGSGTVRQDDPELTVRGVRPLAPGRPRRLILEGRTSLPLRARLLRTAHRQGVIVATTRPGRHPWGRQTGVEVWHVPGRAGRVAMGPLLRRLGAAGVSYVLVEGGGETHAAFLGLDRPAGRVWADQIQWILAPRLLGGRKAPGPVGGRGADHPDAALRLEHIRWRALGGDCLLTAVPRPARVAKSRA